MRKMIVLITIAFVFGGLLFWSMGYARGFIMISVGNQVIQLSLWMAVVLVLALWCIWRMVFWGLRSLARPGVSIWRVYKQNQMEKNRTRVWQGFESFYEGYWKEAKLSLIRSAPWAEAPALNYLLAAEAAAEMGDDREAEEILATAEKEVDGESLALALARARVLVRGGEYGRAAAVLRKAQERLPQHPYVLRLLKDVYVQQQDWGNLEKLLPDLRRAKAGSQGVLDDLEIVTRQGILGRFLELDSADQSLGRRLENLSLLWSNTPKLMRKNPGLVGLYSEALENVGEHKRAEAELRQQINREWDARLVRIWSKLEIPELPKKISVAEGWLKNHGGSAELLLVLGQVCRRSELWGKAKDYLERSIKIDGSPQAYGELAAVMEQLGERGKSDEYYQLGLKSSLEPA